MKEREEAARAAEDAAVGRRDGAVPGRRARTESVGVAAVSGPARRGSTSSASRRTATERADASFDLAFAVGVRPPVQRRAGGSEPSPAPTAGSVGERAAVGVAGPASALPHIDAIQAAFGAHDVSGIKAHVGGAAATAAESIGAQAYATGSSVAFAAHPDLHTAAHEAAHIVQQRQGVQLKEGVGQAGDSYERQADAVADAVVRGDSAERLLGEASTGANRQGVQLKKGRAQGQAADRQLHLSTERMVFTPTHVGKASRPRTLRIANRSPTGIVIASLESVAGGVAYEVDIFGFSSNTPIEPGSLLIVEIAFTPSRPGRFSEHLVARDSTGAILAALDVIGVGKEEPSPKPEPKPANKPSPDSQKEPEQVSNDLAPISLSRD